MLWVIEDDSWAETYVLKQKMTSMAELYNFWKREFNS